MIQDKMTMAHSIENRVPFTDRRMFDLVSSLPSKLFVKRKPNLFGFFDHNRNTKILLKKITAKYYNPDFVYRRKSGFDQPLSDYFGNQLIKDLINDLLLPGIKHRGIYDFNFIKREWESFINQSGNLTYLRLFWNAFSFELWAQLFIDKKLTT